MQATLITLNTYNALNIYNTFTYHYNNILYSFKLNYNSYNKNFYITTYKGDFNSPPISSALILYPNTIMQSVDFNLILYNANAAQGEVPTPLTFNDTWKIGLIPHDN